MFVKTPPMGWNSWNTFGVDISADLICQVADAIVAKGLDKAGYQYVVIDDGWSEKERDPETGKIVPDRKKFPNGIKAVSDYVHSKGLKFGMYSCAGVRTCGDYPGSFDHEFLDARTFAEYGCDFLKYDFCYFPDVSDCAMLYRRMGNALRACGRDILFSACCWGTHDVWSWARSAGVNAYRSTYDIRDNFASFSSIAKSQWQKFCYSGTECFNDLDMLTVGMFGKGFVGMGDACTIDDYRTQFGLWCFFGTPLMLGNDVRNMTDETLELLTNRELLAVNQDPECRPPFMAYHLESSMTPEVFIFAKLLHDGDLAVGFFNCKTDSKAPEEEKFSLLFENIGFPVSSGYGLHFKDMFTGEDLGVKQEIFTVQSLPKRHCRAYRATPVKIRN